jgi:hypothetical protein
VNVVSEWVLPLAGVIAASLAAVFAYPTLRQYRAKPDLRLVIEKGPATSAWVIVRLHNSGSGATSDWKVRMVTEQGQLRPKDWEMVGWSARETPPGWTSTWLAGGPQDAIAARLHREFTAYTIPQHVTGTYSIRANRMKERTGHFRITIGDEPERNQTIEVRDETEVAPVLQWLMCLWRW